MLISRASHSAIYYEMVTLEAPCKWLHSNAVNSFLDNICEPMNLQKPLTQTCKLIITAEKCYNTHFQYKANQFYFRLTDRTGNMLK